MADDPHPQPSIEEVAVRLASLLTGHAGGLRDPSSRDFIFEDELSIRPLTRSTGATAATDVWAVDGGQTLLADARCLQVYATRAARVRWRDGRTVLEDEGTLTAYLIGLGEERNVLATLRANGAPIAADASVDVNLLRDWSEWSATQSCVAEAEPGGLVLVDGDLQPDWRIQAAWLADLFSLGDDRKVTLVGVTKHTSLSWGGGPLIGYLERLAGEGDRTCWWVPIARTRPDVGPGIQVAIARLDPDARFAFRVDLPGDCDAGAVLGQLSALCDDAAFPGYPYPLSVADRLAACPGWVRDEAWGRIDARLQVHGVAGEVRDRAFTDRHRLMERH